MTSRARTCGLRNHPENADAAGLAPTASSERTETACKQNGTSMTSLQSSTVTAQSVTDVTTTDTPDTVQAQVRDFVAALLARSVGQPDALRVPGSNAYHDVMSAILAGVEDAAITFHESDTEAITRYDYRFCLYFGSQMDRMFEARARWAAALGKNVPEELLHLVKMLGNFSEAAADDARKAVRS